MPSPTMPHTPAQPATPLFEDWFDPIETGLREKVRGFIEAMIRSELDAVLARPRYARQRTGAHEANMPTGVPGHRHGSRTRTLMGTFGPTEISVPRARLVTPEGKTTEWKSTVLRAYQRRTRAADALIASTYLSGTNTRRVRRALAALFRGRGVQGHREPGLAQGEERLGRLERPLSGTGAHRAPDPRRDRGPGPSRPKGDLDLSARRPGRAGGRPEGAAVDQEHGRGD